VVVAALAIWWFGRSDRPEPNRTSASGVSLAVEPGERLPELQGGAVTIDSAGDPFFVWTNPSPRQGDQYHWWPLATPDQTHLTGGVQVAVPRREFGGGPVCIEVQLVRDEKTSSDRLRICEN
jgi:hypothetical protein